MNTSIEFLFNDEDIDTDGIIPSMCLVLCNLDLMAQIIEISSISIVRRIFNHLESFGKSVGVRVVVLNYDDSFIKTVATVIGEIIRDRNVKDIINRIRNKDLDAILEPEILISTNKRWFEDDSSR